MNDQPKTSKAERTSQFILEKVAPVFNKKGYVGTSMADITNVTGLTKGAIYGNFGSKEELALAAFNYNFKRIIQQLNERVMEQESAIDKLKALTDYYRQYYAKVIDYGGCPVVNLSVDTHYQNPQLFKKVSQVVERLMEKMTGILILGIEQGVLRPEIDPVKYSKLIFAQIEGGIFTSVMTKDPSGLSLILDHVDSMIANELSV